MNKYIDYYFWLAKGVKIKHFLHVKKPFLRVINDPFLRVKNTFFACKNPLILTPWPTKILVHSRWCRVSIIGEISQNHTSLVGFALLARTIEELPKKKTQTNDNLKWKFKKSLHFPFIIYIRP